MITEDDLIALQKRVDDLERMLRSGIPTNYTSPKVTLISEDDPDIVDPPTAEEVKGSEGDMYMIYKADT
jgi:hypothetical protein